MSRRKHVNPIDDANLKRFEDLAYSRDGDGWNWAKGVVERLKMVEAEYNRLVERVSNQSKCIRGLQTELRTLRKQGGVK